MSYIQPIINAFLSKKDKKINNTESLGGMLFLFGNKIAEWRNNDIWITTCGWKTATTRDRLQLLGANLKVRKGIWYLNNEEWQGNWVNMEHYTKEKVINKQNNQLFS